MARRAHAGVDDGHVDGVRGHEGEARPIVTAPRTTSCRGTEWVRSITRQSGAIAAMTPWQTPTNTSASP